MTLNALPGLLAGEAVVAELLAANDAVVAIPEAGRALAIAAISELGNAPVVLVATPTAREADQLTHDLAAFVGPDCVDLLPAWETLPFERVSPASDTMGRRLRAMWHLRHGGSAPGGAGERTAGLAPQPSIVVAPVRALLQRLGPKVEDAEPVVVARGTEIDAGGLIAKLVHAGYRREYQVEHRGEVSVRGGIIDVFPSTADEGIRIDLWGDEVERLTIFDVSDQRSIAEIERAEIFGCRELVLTDEVRERARVLAKESPFARDVFDRIADGLTFDGMESWLPWLTDEERLFTDLLHPDARVVLVEPRRLRDRAAELIEEETSLAQTLSSTWLGERGDDGRKESGANTGGGAAPAGAASFLDARLHLPFERLMSRSGARMASVLPIADRPDVTSLVANPWAPVMGDAAGLARRLGELARTGYRVVVCADGRGSAERLQAVLETEGLDAEPPPRRERRRVGALHAEPGRPRRRCVDRQGSASSGIQAGAARRGRPDGPAPPAPGGEAEGEAGGGFLR